MLGLTVPVWADVRCTAEPQWVNSDRQGNVVFQCLNPDPIPKTLLLTLYRQHLTDGLPDHSVHVLRAGELGALRSLRITGPDWDLSYQVSGLMGIPRETVPHTIHRLPFESGTRAVVAQVYGGVMQSHHDAASQHAVDFGVPLGTVVLASQSGVVARVKDGSTSSGPSSVFQGLENLVVIYHPDDTWSVYGHLEAGSLRVRPGDVVSVGQALARTGRSGMMWGPHLHFAVQMRTAQGIVSIPVPFESKSGDAMPLRQAQAITID